MHSAQCALETPTISTFRFLVSSFSIRFDFPNICFQSEWCFFLYSISEDVNKADYYELIFRAHNPK